MRAKKPNYPAVTSAPRTGAELFPRIFIEVLGDAGDYMYLLVSLAVAVENLQLLFFLVN